MNTLWYSRILQNSDETIAIIGLGHENLQLLTWLIETVNINTSRIILADATVKPATFLQPLLKAYPDIKTFFGDNYLTCLNDEYNVRWVFKAPGVWSNLPQLQDFRARNGQDSVHSSLVFFIEACRKNIIGVTGTKGKTTTSSVIAHLLSSLVHSPVQYCGNSTNISPYQFWLEAQNPPTNTLFVLELSSFQLQDLDKAKISPAVSVVTNYFIDHLDQHENVEEYWAAKDAILRYQLKDDFAIVSQQMTTRTQHAFLHRPPIIIEPPQVREFVHALHGSLLLRGDHNGLNVTQAAYAVAAMVALQSVQNNFASDISSQSLQAWVMHHAEQFATSMQSFLPVQHRLQHVFSVTIDGVKVCVWDDGAATEPDAVAAAIRAVCSPQSLTLLHVAGVDKGGDINDLLQAITTAKQENTLYGVCANGSIGVRILQENNTLEFLNNPTDTFKNAVKTLYANYIAGMILQAKKSNISEINLLFSPSGSSFDEFDSYTQRANWWVETTRETLQKLEETQAE